MFEVGSICNLNSMAAGATGARVVFFGAHREPNYFVENFVAPDKEELQEGEILVKILLCTICPLDIDHIDGKREKLKTPCVLGHEGVGEVLISRRVGDGTKLHPGDRITFAACNVCWKSDVNKTEAEETCNVYIEQGRKAFKDCSVLSGCYSTHMVLKPSIHVVVIPRNVTNSVVSPANCSLATMVHAVTFLTSNPELRRSLAVIQGANLMGLYGCALLHDAGYQKVFCHDTSSERLRLVSKFNGVPVHVKKEYEPNNRYEPGPNSADVVIDVCGDWNVTSYGLTMLCNNGTYIFVGTPHKERASQFNIDVIIQKGITVRGIQGYKSAHLDKAVSFLSRTTGKYPYESLVSSPFSLQDFHSAVNMARSQRYYRTAVKPGI